MKPLRCLIPIVFIVASARLGVAQMPETISFQGFLTDTLGAPVPDGNYEITFALYDTSGVVWSENLIVPVKRGAIDHLLSSASSLGAREACCQGAAHPGGFKGAGRLTTRQDRDQR